MFSFPLPIIFGTSNGDTQALSVCLLWPGERRGLQSAGLMTVRFTMVAAQRKQWPTGTIKPVFILGEIAKSEPIRAVPRKRSRIFPFSDSFSLTIRKLKDTDFNGWYKQRLPYTLIVLYRS